MPAKKGVAKKKGKKSFHHGDHRVHGEYKRKTLWSPCALWLNLFLHLLDSPLPQKTEISTDYENPNSEIIPLLLSTESLDENWTITKIFNTQSNKPFTLEGLENLEEISVMAFWTYYGNDKEKNILIEHTLYRFEYLPEIPNSIIDKEYDYLGENEYGIKKFIKCKLSEDFTKSNRCIFVFIKYSLISTLAVLADNQINSNAIENIKKVATPLLEDIEKKDYVMGRVINVFFLNLKI